MDRHPLPPAWESSLFGCHRGQERHAQGVTHLVLDLAGQVGVLAQVLAGAGGIEQLDVAAHRAGGLEGVVRGGELGMEERAARVPVDEPQVLDALATLASRNASRRSMIGLGYHDTVTPPVITRNVLQNPAWYTAYTPYQAEISQGILQAIYEYQTMISRLTGMQVANASMYDGSTACWEAVAMAARITKRKRVVLSGALHPHYAEVVKTIPR